MQDHNQAKASGEMDGYPKTWSEWFYFPNLDAWAKRWTIWFAILYFFPFFKYPLNPWGYVEGVYVRGFFGLPGFMCEAVLLWLTVIVSLFIYYSQAKSRGMFGETADKKE